MAKMRVVWIIKLWPETQDILLTATQKSQKIRSNLLPAQLLAENDGIGAWAGWESDHGFSGCFELIKSTNDADPVYLILLILFSFFGFCMKTRLWTMDGFAQKKHQKLTFETPPNLPKVPSTKDLLTPSPKPLPSPRRRFSCKVSPPFQRGLLYLPRGLTDFQSWKNHFKMAKTCTLMDSWMVSPFFWWESWQFGNRYILLVSAGNLRVGLEPQLRKVEAWYLMIIRMHENRETRLTTSI